MEATLLLGGQVPGLLLHSLLTRGNLSLRTLGFRFGGCALWPWLERSRFRVRLSRTKIVFLH